MVTSNELKIIADAGMAQVLILTQIANKQERDSYIQKELYDIKNSIYDTVSKLWPLAASLRIEELRGIGERL